MATTRIFYGIICFAIIGRNGQFISPLLKQKTQETPAQTAAQKQVRINLIRRAQNEIGVRERTGRNDGNRVEAYLASVGLKRGEPYCAAFVSYVFHQEGFLAPNSAWSPDLLPVSRLARSALPGNVIGIYFPEKKRIAHVGLIEKEDGDWIVSIEANTNITGSREGDGVYVKRRHRRTISCIADWVTKGRRLP